MSTLLPAPVIMGISAVRSWPPPTPPIAPAIVLPSVPKLTSFDAAPAALPPSAPAISWMMRFMIVADIESSPARACSIGRPPRPTNRAGHALTYTTAKALSRYVKGILALVRSQMTDGSRPPRRHIQLSAHFSSVTGLRRVLWRH
jgi:hypothetical protein